jgi:polyisoprenyl-phosphate glycosyltransferase
MSSTYGNRMLLSVVIPVYNEAEVIGVLLATLRPILADVSGEYELVFVDDGSRDDTGAILAIAAESDPRTKILTFSRNFGHQAAITAGLDFAQGDAVIVLDADLQDPPMMISKMLSLYQEGYDVVSAQRISRSGEGFLKRWTATCFYWLIRNMVDDRIIPEVGDFRLFSRAAVVALRSFRERHRFMRGIVAWLGLREAVIPYHREVRAAGSTKYSWMRMAALAWVAISSFSAFPLRLVLLGGVLLSIAGALYTVYVIYVTLVLRTTVPGWSSLVCLQVIFSGATLTAIGLMGDYIARIYEENKRRPLYVISNQLNITAQQVIPEAIVVMQPRTYTNTVLTDVLANRGVKDVRQPGLEPSSDNPDDRRV